MAASVNPFVADRAVEEFLAEFEKYQEVRAVALVADRDWMEIHQKKMNSTETATKAAFRRAVVAIIKEQK